ncbi:MAG: hypothetical protein HMLIMOIP_002598 [Candidatus Nitrosomirales archaeon]|jgi:hypothetical protein
MGILTWIVVAVVVLAVIGLGVGAFYSGILNGAQKVGTNTVVANVTEGVKEFADSVTKSASNN